MSSVLVFGPRGEPLNPCHPARARELLRKQRAQIASTRPYAIRLLEPGSAMSPTRSPAPVGPLHPETHDEV